MFAFPGMLVSAAEKAGIAVPSDPNEFEAEDYPHFALFCIAQLGQSMPYPGVHFDNARVIAEVSFDEIKTITYEQLFERGFNVGHSSLYA